LRAPRSSRLDAEPPDPGLHLGLLARQASDPAVVPWHWPARDDGGGGARSREQARAMLERYRDQLERRGFTWWPWRERSSDELVGLRCGLEEIVSFTMVENERSRR
jgi:hypothetical protein